MRWTPRRPKPGMLRVEGGNGRGDRAGESGALSSASFGRFVAAIPAAAIDRYCAA